MSKNILSVSYDASLLATRRMLLEQRGYHVVSALGFTQAVAHCKTPDFDLFILGHSIPVSDKQELIRTFRQNCPAPILSLERHGEERVQADFHASPDEPEEFLATVDRVLALEATRETAEPEPQPQDRAR
jgi:DNA-binding response OmpR family regulator